MVGSIFEDCSGVLLGRPQFPHWTSGNAYETLGCLSGCLCGAFESHGGVCGALVVEWDVPRSHRHDILGTQGAPSMQNLVAQNGLKQAARHHLKSECAAVVFNFVFDM